MGVQGTVFAVYERRVCASAFYKPRVCDHERTHALIAKLLGYAHIRAPKPLYNVSVWRSVLGSEGIQHVVVVAEASPRLTANAQVAPTPDAEVEDGRARGIPKDHLLHVGEAPLVVGELPAVQVLDNDHAVVAQVDGSNHGYLPSPLPVPGTAANVPGRTPIAPKGDADVGAVAALYYAKSCPGLAARWVADFALDGAALPEIDLDVGHEGYSRQTKGEAGFQVSHCGHHETSSR